MRCRVVRAVDLNFWAFLNTTAYSLADGDEIVGLQDSEGLRTEGCFWL